MIIRRSPRAFIYRPGRPPIIVRGGGGSGGGGGGVTDHGALTGLTDDDHSQYALANGSRGEFATVAQGAKADSATQPADLSAAISTHAGAADPHGDRAYAAANFVPVRITLNATVDIDAGELIVLNNGTQWTLADASTEGGCLGIIGYAESSVTAGNPLSGLVSGVIDLGLLSPVGSGSTAFVSATTPGALQLGPPPAIGRVVGFVQNTGSSYLLYFNGAANVPLFGAGTGMAVSTADSRLSNARTPTSHASSHAKGGGDALKLDDLAAPDDNTDLDATTSAHGLLPKLGGGTTDFLRADGTWSAPAGGSPGGSSGQLQYNNAGAFGGIAGSSWASNQLLITAQAAATTPLAIRAAASHTAAIQEWQNSAGTTLAKTTAAGNFVGSTYTSGSYVPAFGFAGYETTGVMGYQTSCYFISNGSIALVASTTGVSTRTNSPLSWRDSGSSTTRGSIVATSAGDVEITPTGSGLVKFGTHAAIGAETITGYIEIKDSGGTTRKIPIVS